MCLPTECKLPSWRRDHIASEPHGLQASEERHLCEISERC